MWTCLGVVGLAIKYEASLSTFDTLLNYIDIMILWWVIASTRYDSKPYWWYGTPFEARVHLDPFAQGWSGGSTPFSLSLSIMLSISLFIWRVTTSVWAWMFKCLMYLFGYVHVCVWLIYKVMIMCICENSLFVWVCRFWSVIHVCRCICSI